MNGSATRTTPVNGIHLHLHGGLARTDDDGGARPPEPDRALEATTVPRGPRVSLRARLVLLDTLAIVAAWLVTFAISRPVANAALIPAVTLSIALGLITIAASRLYQARVSTVRSTEFARLGPVALATASSALSVPMLMHHEERVAAALLLAAVSFVCLIAERSLFDAWLRAQRARGRHCRPIIIVGTAAEARELSLLLHDHPEFGYRVVGFVGPDPEHDLLPAGSPWLGDLTGILTALEAVGANGVLIASDALRPDQMAPLVQTLSRHGIHIHLSGGLWGLDHRRIRTVPIAHEPLLYVEPLKVGRVRMVVKRVGDVVMASLALVLSLPILAAAAIAIRLEDGGPAIFRQPRVGLDGETFSLLKLRTMTPETASDRAGIRPGNGREGPLFKARTVDPRVTRVGRILRGTSLDELPQLVNVLRGDMSLVGPRPALESEAEQFDDELLTRNRIRPGITGLWQVEARDNPSFRPYRRLDLFYVENWSLMLDLVILMMTAEVVVTRAVRMLRNRNAQELTSPADTVAANPVSTDLVPADAVIDLRQ